MRWLIGALWCVASLAAQALEFRSVDAEAAVLYDTIRAGEEAVYSLPPLSGGNHRPLDKWVKVRDEARWRMESSKLAVSAPY